MPVSLSGIIPDSATGAPQVAQLSFQDLPAKVEATIILPVVWPISTKGKNIANKFDAIHAFSMLYVIEMVKLLSCRIFFGTLTILKRTFHVDGLHKRSTRDFLHESMLSGCD